MRPLEDGLLQLHQSITEDTVTVLVSGVHVLCRDGAARRTLETLIGF